MIEIQTEVSSKKLQVGTIYIVIKERKEKTYSDSLQGNIQILYY